MDLKTYFQQSTPAEREVLAEKVGYSVGYLYLCTRTPKKGKPRQPGPDLCKALVAADPRFTLADLRPDLWGNGIDVVAASDDVQPPVGSGPKKGDKLAKLAA